MTRRSGAGLGETEVCSDCVMNPLRGYQCASLGYLIVLFVVPLACLFTLMTVATGGGFKVLVSIPIALLAFSVFFQRAIVIEVSAAGVSGACQPLRDRKFGKSLCRRGYLLGSVDPRHRR